MFESFDKTYIIYLGVGIVIVAVAFFAYQELQKHKMEIQKLRYESEKLQKIIHAYNMKQWHQDPSEEPNESDDSDSDEDSEEAPTQSFSSSRSTTSQSLREKQNTSSSSTNSQTSLREQANGTSNRQDLTRSRERIPINDTIPSQQVQDVISETLSSLAAKESRQPQVSAPATPAPMQAPQAQAQAQAQAPVMTLSHSDEQEPMDDLPDVESFAFETTKQSRKDNLNSDEDDSELENKPEQSIDEEIEVPPVVVGVESESEDSETVVPAAPVTVKEGSPVTVDDNCVGCPVVLKTGNRIGKQCGITKKLVGGMCLKHYKNSNGDTK